METVSTLDFKQSRIVEVDGTRCSKPNQQQRNLPLTSHSEHFKFQYDKYQISEQQSHSEAQTSIVLTIPLEPFNQNNKHFSKLEKLAKMQMLLACVPPASRTVLPIPLD